MRSLSVLLGLYLTVCSTFRGETYVVFPDVTGDFPTIQEAVDNVQNGDIIELGDGVFPGKGNRDVDYLGKAITIRSQDGDPEACIVDCEAGGEDHRGFLMVDVGAGAVLEGMTVRNAIHAFGGGVCCYGESSPPIKRCVFYRNRGGIHARAGPHAPLFANTIIASSRAGAAVLVGGSTPLALSCCDIYGNEGGDWVGRIAGQYGINGNICEDPLFCGPDHGDLHLHCDSPCAPFSLPNPECDLIGAWPVGCGGAPVAGTTWGGIKALFASGTCKLE